MANDPKIAAASGAATRMHGTGKTQLSSLIQSAIEASIRKAAEDGVTDPAKVREYIQAARAKAKKEFFDNANLASAAKTQADKAT